MNADDLIHQLKLDPLKGEGGFFRRTYESSLPFEGEGERRVASAIFYLVTPESFSSLHRLHTADELFCFMQGDPVEMIQIDSHGELAKFRLGQNLGGGELGQVLVRPGVWQGTRLIKGGHWALLTCFVAPEFIESDYEIAERDALKSLFPQHENEIAQFTS